MTMETFVPVLVTVLLVIVALALSLGAVRLLRGPGLADRIIAMDMLVIAAVAVAALAALSTGRREFLDVALGVAVIGFVATCAFAAFMERRARKQPRLRGQPPRPGKGPYHVNPGRTS